MNNTDPNGEFEPLTGLLIVAIILIVGALVAAVDTYFKTGDAGAAVKDFFVEIATGLTDPPAQTPVPNVPNPAIYVAAVEEASAGVETTDVLIAAATARQAFVSRSVPSEESPTRIEPEDVILATTVSGELIQIAGKEKGRGRDTGLENVADEEVQKKARDKTLSGEERRRYQKEEKNRALRNIRKRGGANPALSSRLAT